MADRILLEGVPRIGFYAGGPRPPMDDTFSGALGACLEYLGQDLGLGRLDRSADETAHAVHCRIMGLVGSAFKLAVDPDRNLAATSHAGGVAEPWLAIQAAVRSTGFEPRIWRRGDSEAIARERLLESLEQGRPAIAMGVAGPPEFAVLTGYESSEDAAIGWSYFQDWPEFAQGLEKEPNGMFRDRR